MNILIDGPFELQAAAVSFGSSVAFRALPMHYSSFWASERCRSSRRICPVARPLNQGGAGAGAETELQHLCFGIPCEDTGGNLLALRRRAWVAIRIRLVPVRVATRVLPVWVWCLRHHGIERPWPESAGRADPAIALGHTANSSCCFDARLAAKREG